MLKKPAYSSQSVAFAILQMMSNNINNRGYSIFVAVTIQKKCRMNMSSNLYYLKPDGLKQFRRHLILNRDSSTYIGKSFLFTNARTSLC